MALNLARKLTVYTNGDDAIATDIETNAKFATLQARVTLEKRRIKSVKLLSREASDVLVTLEDGTEIKQAFIVRITPNDTYTPIYHTGRYDLRKKKVSRYLLSYNVNPCVCVVIVIPIDSSSSDRAQRPFRLTTWSRDG